MWVLLIVIDFKEFSRIREEKSNDLISVDFFAFLNFRLFKIHKYILHIKNLENGYFPQQMENIPEFSSYKFTLS